MTQKKKNNKKEKKSSLYFLLINLTAMAIVVVAAVLITFRWIDNYTEHGVAIIVPDITGMQEVEAIKVLAEHHLIGVVSDHTYIKGIPSGDITAQRPVQNAKVKRGRKIYLTVSTGNHPMIAIPDIIDNTSLRQAESRLRAAGFKLAPNDTIDGELDWVYGIRYQGRKLQNGEKVPEGTELTIIIGGGKKDKVDMIGATVEEGWF